MAHTQIGVSEDRDDEFGDWLDAFRSQHVQHRQIHQRDHRLYVLGLDEQRVRSFEAERREISLGDFGRLVEHLPNVGEGLPQALAHSDVLRSLTGKQKDGVIHD